MLNPENPNVAALLRWRDAAAVQLNAGVEPPELELPVGDLEALRDTLYEAADLAMAAGGWPGRTHRLPPESITTPAVFLDVLTVSSQGNGTVATLPLVLMADGARPVELKQLDRLTMLLWTALEAATDDTGQAFQLLTAGPQDVDLGGPTTVAVVFVVQLGLRPRTLSPQPLASDPTP